MARDKKRARSIAQAQKQRRQEKAASPSPQPARNQAAATAGGSGTAQASTPARAASARLTAPPAPGNLERKVTVRLDADRFAQLEAYARREGFTVSVVVRHLLCRFLEDQRRFPGGRAL